MLNVVCYSGGTCGDLVSAMIDPKDAELKLSRIVMPQYRSRLKKPHQFVDSLAKDQYIQEISLTYRSIPSHDLQYHRGQDFIGITVEDRCLAEQAARRFRDLHRPEVWAEMQKCCGAESIEQYAMVLIDFSTLVQQHATWTLKLEDIVAGLAIQRLVQIGKVVDETSQDLYQSWLSQQHWI